jgi:hypothetical protein
MALTLFSLCAGLLQIMVFGASQSVSAGPTQLQPPAGNSTAKDKCTVSGQVSNMQTGEPLKKANLHFSRHNNARNADGAFQSTGYSGVSGPDGSFKFEGVEPGEYSLIGEKPGYLQTQYGSKNGLRAGTTLNLQPGQQLTDLKLQLIPQAIISGKVIDDDGDPVSGASVQAVGRFPGMGSKLRYFPVGQGSTDDTGTYRIANLRPGKYYVAAQSMRQQMMGMREAPATPGTPDIRPVRTFYPSSLDRASASQVDLKPGEEMPGVEIRMRSVETFHIRGKLTGDLTESNGQPAMLMLMPEGGDGSPFMFGGAGLVAKDHTFEFAGVAPGAYVIAMGNFNGQQRFARQTVEVGNGDVNDVMLTTQPTFTLRGSIELQGALAGSAKDKGLESIQVMLIPDDESGVMFNSSQAMTKADGTFTMEKVAPGKVRVHVMNEPEGSYLKSIRFGQAETLGKTLDLTQASGGEIHVVLRSGAAEVGGTVQTKQEDASAGSGSALAPASSASVLLIPEDLTLNGGSVHTAGTNQHGVFTAKGLAPGRYYAVAYEAEDYQNFDDPAILKQLVGKGTNVEVKENDKQQIQLTLVPAEDLRAALTAAGIVN